MCFFIHALSVSVYYRNVRLEKRYAASQNRLKFAMSSLNVLCLAYRELTCDTKTTILICNGINFMAPHTYSNVRPSDKSYVKIA